MAKLVPRNFSNLKRIQTVDKKYFRDLLRPFADDCKRFGLDLDHLTDDALFKFFTAFDTKTSGELLEVMHLLDDVAYEDGADRLRELARARGHDLTGGRPDVDPREMAIRAYLFDRNLVLRVHDRLGYRKVTSFREFIGATAAAIKVPADATLRRIEARFAAYFGQQDRGEFCEIRSYPEGTDVNFVIIHGKRYARERVRDERYRPKTLPFRPEKHDLVIYDNRTGRLKINAQYPAENDEYRRVFGELLFSGPKHFERTDVYDLSPLQRRGADALDCTGIPGIQWVHLAEVKVVVGADGQGSFEHHLRARESGGDIFKILAVHPVADLRHGKMTYAKLHVKLDGVRGGPRALEIFPDNRARYNRWTHSAAVAELIERNGLVARPLGPTVRAPAPQVAPPG